MSKWYKWTGDIIPAYARLVCIEPGCIKSYRFDGQVFKKTRPYEPSTKDWIKNTIPNSDMWVQISEEEAFAELL